MTKLDWEEIAPHPSAIVSIGRPGSGKSVLQGTYMDYCRDRDVKVCMVNKPSSYPKWITRLPNIEKKTPKNSLTALDDAHLHGLYAHEYSTSNKAMDFIQRQKRHGSRGSFYTTQEGSGLTLRIYRTIDCLCVFKPSLFGDELDRDFIKVLYEKAEEGITRKGQVFITWVNWKNDTKGEGIYEFDLPEWWTEEMSTGDYSSIGEDRKIYNMHPLLKFFWRIGK